MYICEASTREGIILRVLDLLLGIPCQDDWIRSPWQRQVGQAVAEWREYVERVPIHDPLTLETAIPVFDRFARESPVAHLCFKFAMDHPRIGRMGMRESEEQSGEDSKDEM